MAGVATAANQPGVSVVSMSWGFAEGQAVLAADEAAYDSVFNVPGRDLRRQHGRLRGRRSRVPCLFAERGGGRRHEPHAESRMVLTTARRDGAISPIPWVPSSALAAALSLYEPEPAYQQGVQSTGSRTTPDVSLVADPATGAWIADPYNLDPGNPFEIVGGTSLSAPAWAGVVALVNQGRAAAGESPLNSSSPTDTQQALYMLPQSDYNVITSGSNGYTAGAGYNLVTGLGTPVANLLVPDLIPYQGAGTTYSGAMVAPLQSSGLVNTGTADSGPMDVFSVFDSFTVADAGSKHGRALAVLGSARERRVQPESRRYRRPRRAWPSTAPSASWWMRRRTRH